MRRLPPVLLALALVACVPEIGERAEPVTAPSPVPGAEPGGTLRVAIEAPAGLDPVLAVDPAAQLIVRTMCDQLVALDPATGATQPSLAESWTIADGGRRLFLRLRRDVRFSDGSTLDSEDVAASLARLAAEETASPLAHLLEPVSGYGFVHGEDEPPDDRLRRRLVGVQTIDPHSLQISLQEPFADFIRTLAHPATSPVPGEAEDDPAAFARRPVCAGPYRLETVAWDGAEPVTLARDETAAGVTPSYTRRGLGYADRITFEPVATRAAAARLYRRARVDIAALPESLLPRARRLPGTIVDAPTALVEYVGVPATVPPFDDPAVRVALSRAIDRAAIAARVYDGGREPATGFFPAAVGRTDGCAPDTLPRRAVRLEPDERLRGVRVPFFFNDEGANRAMVREVARAWRRLGLDVRPVPRSFEALEAMGSSPRGIDGAFRFAWLPEFPSPDRILAPLFEPDGIGKDNWSLYGSNALDRVLRAARRAVNETERARAYRRAETILCEEMPMIPVVVDTTHYAVRTDRLIAATGRWTGHATAEPLLREIALRR